MNMMDYFKRGSANSTTPSTAAAINVSKSSVKDEISAALSAAINAVNKLDVSTTSSTAPRNTLGSVIRKFMSSPEFNPALDMSALLTSMLGGMTICEILGEQNVPRSVDLATVKSTMEQMMTSKTFDYDVMLKLIGGYTFNELLKYFKQL